MNDELGVVNEDNQPIGWVLPYVLDKGLDGYTATLNPCKEGRYNTPVYTIIPTSTKQTICTKPLQVKAWIDDNRNLWEFWQTVVDKDTHEMNGKTKLEAVALANYYEGRYDMACNFKMILEEK